MIKTEQLEDNLLNDYVRKIIEGYISYERTKIRLDKLKR